VTATARKHRTISEFRDESVIRNLRLSKAKPSRRKFIVIQIDSLPYSIMKRFLDKGSCKAINHLIEKHGYTIQRWNCGLPSGTPAVQSGIMYGDNSAVPGFRFVDKKTKRQFSFGNPNHVKQFEQEHFSRSRGILRGGSSYSNHFSGGASRSIFTMSTITKDKKMRRIKESTLWLFLFLYPTSVTRVLYYSFAELIIEFFSLLGYPIKRLVHRKTSIFGFWIPFRRLLMNSVLAELITLGAIIDTKRGVPRIYMNYMNYDDIAHLRGPNSVSAKFMVRALDRRIRRVIRSAEDEYDIYIMSDHGQEEAVPFTAINGMTLAEYIEKCAHVPSFGLSSAFEGRLSLISVVMNKTISFLKYVSTPLRWLGTAFARGILRALKPVHRRFNWQEEEQILVSDSCALANVYFNISSERMDSSEIEKKYPRLVEKLVSNRGIGIVLAKEQDKILLFGKGGNMTITDSSVRKEGKDFLKSYGDESVLIKQIRSFNRLKNVGDLVLFGNYADGVSVSFTEHVGAHGGIGGEMQYPFFITNKKIDLSKVTNARELHKIFGKY
jgi:hypothetical protein